MSSRPECPQCGEHWCYAGPSGDGCIVSATPPPAPRASKFYLCFLDFETTGLDSARHEPIEVAAVVTDDRLNELGRFESLIFPSEPVSDWDSEAHAMHERSGLAREAICNGVSRRLANDEFVSFLHHAAPGGTPLHLAGNSVHFDRGFLRTYFPAVEARFHHRHLDVSSLRLVGEIFTSAAPLAGEKPHRAMADVLRSIQELHHWREVLR